MNARHNSIWQKTLGAMLAIGLACWIALGILEANHFRKFIPGKLQVLQPMLIDGNQDLGTLIYGMLVRPEFCGAAIFQLSPATVRQIEGDGLAFFEGVTESRGRFDMNGAGPDGAPNTYAGWKSGPLPHDYVRNVLWSGLLCADIPAEMARQLNAAALRPGSFYTTSGRGNELVVLPELGWVVFTYWD